MLNPLLGRRRLQPLFEEIHKAALAGLNLGLGGDTDTSGELAAMAWLHDRCAGRAQALTIFDVGANVGEYSEALRSEFNGGADIWAFEPAQASFAELERHLGGATQVELRRLGFSDAPGQAELFVRAPGAKVASLHKGHWGQGEESESVELTTVDRFCEEESISRIDFLKLDVEGHELAVLRGAERMLGEGAIEAIQFEFSMANLMSRTYLRDFFTLLGAYDLHRIIRDGLQPVPEYHPRHEVFTGATNYLAVRSAGPLARSRA